MYICDPPNINLGNPNISETTRARKLNLKNTIRYDTVPALGTIFFCYGLQKPHFGGPFNAKPIIERALRKSHVNGTTKLKLYSYIGMGKYLNVCQNSSARRHPVRAQGPTMYILDPLIYRKVLES